MACHLPGRIAMWLVSLWLLKSICELTAFNQLTEHFFGLHDKFIPSEVRIFNSTLPGVNSFTRMSTTVLDAAEISILIAVGMWYKACITNRRPSINLFPLSLTETQGETTVTGAEAQAEVDEQTHSEGSRRNQLPMEAAMSPTYFWSVFATHVRMGDTFHTAGVANFWVPLFAFAVARISAFIIGSIPGMAAGVPSLTTQLCLGIFFARLRRHMYHRLGKKQFPGNNFCTDTLLYGCCCCLAAADDAQTVDNFSGVRVGCCGLELVGEPLIAINE
eukprot:TRINITY_DN106190_c0_g1_i1.p1 TRINITY_DN106190_c0_g1~~TRINITY_DN106190_c0_g1_i1.p1  ORF type:complete len:275 (+),score=38.01 TRINITY_DN106190_c0_g1_i1:56-880(+)